MRHSLIIAILSVTAVGLTAGIVKLKLPKPAVPERRTTIEASQSAVEPPVKAARPKESAHATTASIAAFHWSEVESADYKEYIARLRGVRCPEETIRDIIIADVNKLYAPREAPLKVAGDTEASVSNDRSQRWAPFERRKQLREIQKEKNALLKELLGIDLPLDPLRMRGSRNYEMFEAAFKALPAEKRQLVQEIQENYWEASDALKDKYNNQRNGDYLTEYRQINVDRKAKLAQVLAPDEMEDYEMRTSNVGQNLQYALEGFNATEEEFKAIFRVRKAIDEPFVGNLPAGSTVDATGAGNAVVSDGRNSADREKEALEKIRETLGPERAREYELSQDGTYRNLQRLGERYGLAAETVMQSYELQKKYSEQMRALQNDRSLANEQRNAAMKELRDARRQQLTQTLGERAANAYQRNRGDVYYE
jgi:hypothetical protein